MPDIAKRLYAVIDELNAIVADIADIEDIPDRETGQTPRQLAEMGWPLTGEPVEDTVEPK